MSTEEKELLEQAVVNMTLDNAKLRKELRDAKETKELWWKSYNKEQERVTELKKEIEHLKSSIPVAEVVLNGVHVDEETQ